VIAIIGILMGMLFPAVNGAIDAARKVQAKNDVTQIAMAVIAYETEYGKLPPGPSSSAADIEGVLLQAITGTKTNDNPRKIVFIEANQSKNGRSGVDNITAPTKYVDPWGSAYQIVVDTDYDYDTPLVAKTAGASALVNTNLRKKVAVWSQAKDKKGAYKKNYFVSSYD
jgi:type II secretory pathway pseudopilin PulG